MENVNQKINDCYFYFYSTCKKGDSCAFRHCELALGTEDICENWKRGQCTGVDCGLRHMDNQKKRVAIPCYWENQPGGCRKPHCVFKHYKNNEQTDVVDKTKLILPLMTTDGENNLVGDNSPNDVSTPVFEVVEEEDSDMESVTLPTVEPLVVNFDEESDSGSCASTPAKKTNDVNDHSDERKQITTKKYSYNLDLGIKTLAEIRREKNSENKTEPTLPPLVPRVNLEEDLRARLTERLKNPSRNDNSKELNFKIKTLEEIREERQENKETKEINKSPSDLKEKNTSHRSQKRSSREIYQPRLARIQRQNPPSKDDFGIKSLSEIREERKKREQQEMEMIETTKEDDKDLQNKMESCTESQETEDLDEIPRKKLKLHITKSVEIENVDKVMEIEAKMNVVESSGSVEEDLDFLLGSEDGGSVTSAVKDEELLLELDDIINS